MQFKHNSFFIDLVEVVSAAQFGSAFNQPIFLDQLNCDGSESELFECGRHTGIGLHTCDHSQDVGIRCEGMGIFLCVLFIVDLIFNWTYCSLCDLKYTNSICGALNLSICNL